MARLRRDPPLAGRRAGNPAREFPGSAGKLYQITGSPKNQGFWGDALGVKTMDSPKLAELLFPHSEKKPED